MGSLHNNIQYPVFFNIKDRKGYYICKKKIKVKK